MPLPLVVRLLRQLEGLGRLRLFGGAAGGGSDEDLGVKPL